jgi:hypothetical protein
MGCPISRVLCEKWDSLIRRRSRGQWTGRNARGSVEATILVCTLITTVAAVLSLFPLFGVDLRGIKKPNRMWVALGLSLLSVCLSSFAAYRFFRPRVRDKIVEKPVEKIVEKLVPQECPKPQTPTPVHPKARTDSNQSQIVPPGTTINATTNAPNSAAVGINTGTVNVNTRSHIVLTDDQQAEVTKSLAAFTGRKCFIMLNNATDETSLFGERLRDSMKGAGIECRLESGMMAMEGGKAMPSPLYVQVGKNNQDLAVALNYVLFKSKVVAAPIPTAPVADADGYMITVSTPN